MQLCLNRYSISTSLPSLTTMALGATQVGKSIGNGASAAMQVRMQAEGYSDCVNKLATATADVIALQDRISSLPRRVLASYNATGSRLQEVDTFARGACNDCKHSAKLLCKTYDDAAEAERVRAAQLQAYAGILDTECESEDFAPHSWSSARAEAAALAHRLLEYEWDAPIRGILLRIDASDPMDADSEAVVGARLAIPKTCVGSKPTCEPGKNVFTLQLVDSYGEPVLSVEPEDATVSVRFGRNDCCATHFVTMNAIAGTLAVVYEATASDKVVTVTAGACGICATGSPFTAFSDSYLNDIQRDWDLQHQGAHWAEAALDDYDSPL